uniref:GTD-binding domain-containing protein n=1 Tax=Oryza glumipatula TaxID=40148 RepID=A0A0D9ZEH2_9ORYZ
MAPRTSTVITWRYQQLFVVLSSVILEWVLMLLLLFEGLLSYLVTTFASLCKLHPPCPMCTRLDHVFGTAQPGFYRDLMCNSHKAEASSWAFCHIHQKLVDVHSMCESCLLSFATNKKSNLATYRSLAGKLGVGIGNEGFRPSFSLDNSSEASVIKEDITNTLCSCCSSPLKVKSYPSMVLQNIASAIDTEVNTRHVSRDQLVEEISLVRYSELKTSDSESEPWQHGGVASLLDDAVDNLKEDFTLSHPKTKFAGVIPTDDIAQDQVAKNSDLIQLQNGGSDSKNSQVSAELYHFRADGNANLQSTDFSSKTVQHPTEDSDTTDKSEDDVWHNALDSISELSVTDKPAETSTAENEPKAEFTDRTAMKDSFKAHEDLQLLLSQVSPNDAINIPGVQEQAILNNITRALSLDRNYSGSISESMAIDEAEEHCTVDQLKKQIELDRKSISLLWKELEEERNASAIATNQTMSMITRLQEEKAAMQMETLQYQRMMEEQSQYDREDLQKMAAMVQELEAEIEGYKTKLRDQSLVNEIRDAMRISRSEECETSMSRTARSLSLFEDEKAYISKHLKKLRQKLHQFSNNGKFIDPKKIDDKEDTFDVTNSEDVYQDADEDSEMTNSENSEMTNVIRNGRNFRYLSNGTEGLTNGKDDPEGQYYAMVSENDLVNFEDEISELTAKLKALEADHSFLEHSINSLRNGQEGKELIHGIACSLRELRKMGITWKDCD